jgi:hypothetical protein
MRPLDAPEVRSLRNVLACAVMAHVLDLITTHLRNPVLADEGNPFYLLAQHLGYGGWPYLVLTKVVLVSLQGLAFWWYLRIRHHYLPNKIVRSPRSLIWYGMWDRRPYPKSIWARVFNARKLKYLGVVLAGLALPGGAAAALFISLDNTLCALQRPLPVPLAMRLMILMVVLVFVWWYWAYWHYYQEQVKRGGIRNET